jgi:hypothetical protein
MLNSASKCLKITLIKMLNSASKCLKITLIKFSKPEKKSQKTLVDGGYPPGL